jgi:hypothetical protein
VEFDTLGAIDQARQLATPAHVVQYRIALIIRRHIDRLILLAGGP